jgi:hypothetical protein
MKEALALILQDHPVWIGAFGTFGTILLDRIHLVVGIAVGLTTIVYLIIRIRKELER